jgi:hypothetical protein
MHRLQSNRLMKTRFFSHLFLGLVMVFYHTRPLLAQATDRPKIVLLTSLEKIERSRLRKLVEFWKPEDWTISSALEKNFLDKINHIENSPFEIVIKHYADQYDLWNILRSPDNLAIFWVSHMGAAPKVSKKCLMEVESIISDHDHHNVVQLFKYIHPNLKSLNLVGCSSKQVYQDLIKMGAFDQLPHLRVETFKGWVPAVYGLNKVLKKFIKRKEWISSLPLSKQDAVYCGQQQSDNLKITLTRTIESHINPHYVQSVRVTINGEILAVFPKGLPGDIQEQSITIDPSKITKKNDLKIIIDSGSIHQDKNHLYLGTFQIQGNWSNALWKIFSTMKTGLTLGVTQHIYQYRGDLPPH